MLDCKLETLNDDNLDIAMEFAVAMKDDANFTHFRHHMPDEMINNEWEVCLAIVEGEVAGWGHIQKFPDNLEKRHVCRVGFAVLPRRQGLGYGGILMDYIIFDRCHQFAKIVATTFQDNLTMFGMFINRGFHVEGCFVGEEKRGGYYRDVVSLARMQ